NPIVRSGTPRYNERLNTAASGRTERTRPERSATMNAARLELKLVLDEAGISQLDLRTFSQRFNIQKRIYLIQLMGLDLGYRYGWYLRGPYSRSLTADAFALRDELIAGETHHAAYRLSPKAAERIAKARKLWDVPSGLSIGTDEWLELLASLHYLRHIAYWPKGCNKDFEAVFSALGEAKPQFAAARGVAERAWERLDGFGLIDAKTAA